MYDYHILAGVLGVVLGLIGYGLYFRSVIKGETRPHIFTWTTYALIDGTVFLAQLFKGAGPGSWALLLSAIENVIVICFAIWRGERHISKLDWVSFCGALFAIVLWWLTKEPLTAVIIASVINVLGAIPTFRKSFLDPFGESVTVWFVDVIRFLLSLVAIVTFNFTTALFPIVIVLTNALLVSMILIRRRQLKHHGL